jgi:1,2-diacylglycerol 3-alpha-glucosyltransferase
VRLPLAAALSDRLDAFAADIMHAHHPFLLGDTALRVSANKNIPIIFTHHTRYEDYTHYMPLASEALTKVAKELPTHFANMCDGVIAPSESIARLLKRRGVTAPMAVVPTGIDVKAFAAAEGAAFRKRFKIPAEAFVVGHIGRLAQEKNLGYLGEGVVRFIKRTKGARFLVVGDGPAKDELKALFDRQGVGDRLILAGKHTGKVLREAYRAMDVFAFSSMSETQGMVVAEAMAAGLPVVALNAPGVREVVVDGKNGFLLPAKATADEFAKAIAQIAKSDAAQRKLSKAAQTTAAGFSREQSAARALAFYEEIRRATRRRRLINDLHPWQAFVQRLGLEWDLLATRTSTIASAVLGDSETKKAS